MDGTVMLQLNDDEGDVNNGTKALKVGFNTIC